MIAQPDMGNTPQKDNSIPSHRVQKKTTNYVEILTIENSIRYTKQQ